MKKFTKCLAVISSAIMALSVGVVQTFAAESENGIVWKVEEGRNLHTDSCQITYYEDGTFERLTAEFCYVVVTVPEGVEPSLEYFGVDRINSVAKFEEKFMYQTCYGEEIWSELEPGENEYLIHMTLNGFQTVCELEDEATEIARNLMAEGKITSARVNHKVCRDTFNYIGGIQIITDETVENIGKPSDYPELAGFYDENSDEFDKDLMVKDDTTLSVFSLNDYYDDKDICTNILSVCDSLVQNNNDIISAEPIYPFRLCNSTEEPELYAAKSIYMWGDISRDNSIDLYDAIEISKYIMNISDIDEDTVLLADINRDGKTNIYDAIEVARYIMEK